MEHKHKVILKLIALAILIFVTIAGAQAVLDNVHTLTEGAVYRSAQLRPRKLEKMILNLNLKSILNLRGESLGAEWYENQMSVARKFGVIHYDVDLSAKSYVPPERLNQIVDLIRAAPKPILIHCHGGADRTGLVSAAWKYAAESASPETASHQLSIWFGHFPFLIWRDSSAMDASLKDFIPATPSPEPIRSTVE